MRGIAPPTTLSVKVKPEPRGNGLDLDRDVGELPVAAALPLEARMLLGPVPDRLLVGDRGGPAVDREVVAVAQAVHRDLQMDVALSPQHHLLGVGVLVELEGRVLLDELADGAGQFDVVGALFRGDRQAKDRLRPLGARQRVGLARRGQHDAGRDILHAGQPDDLAGVRRRRAFRAAPPVTRNRPATRVPFSTMPSVMVPRQTRARDSLPVCGR